MAAPLGPPPSLAITCCLPSGMTRVSVWRAISTSITEPSGIATGPSGNLSPEVISLCGVVICTAPSIAFQLRLIWRLQVSSSAPRLLLFWPLGGRHARGPPEGACKGRLRIELGGVSNLGERRVPGRDHCLSALQPPSADIAMGRRSHGGGKCAGEMEDAETRDIGKVGDGDVFSEM